MPLRPHGWPLYALPPARDLRRLAGAPDLPPQGLLDPRDAQVEERPGAEHGLAWMELRDLVADRRQRFLLAMRQRGGQLGPAGETLLELEERLEILGEDELAQVLLGQHDHRLIAELLVEVLGRLVLRGPLADQRVRAGVGIELGRGEDPGAGEQHDRQDQQPGPRTATPATRSKNLPAFTRRRLGSDYQSRANSNGSATETTA